MQIPNLRQWRELRGLTQKELAERAGLHVRGIAGYEAGAGARPNTVRKLAETLSVDVMDLAGVDAIPKGQAPPSSQPSFDELLDEARRNEWFAAYDRLGRRMFDSWESELDRRETYARENPGAFLVWVEGIIETSNAYTEEVRALDLDAGRPWPALANELDPKMRDRDRVFWRRVRGVLSQIQPRVDRTDLDRLMQIIETEAEAV
ncbi:MAG: helix-turn-helix transcriptional regulator [Actinomycetota bacterium]|nr:helix-turn-helix transcriptional regulator [Actinomycetota bacterium]